MTAAIISYDELEKSFNEDLSRMLYQAALGIANQLRVWYYHNRLDSLEGEVFCQFVGEATTETILAYHERYEGGLQSQLSELIEGFAVEVTSFKPIREEENKPQGFMLGYSAKLTT